MTRKQRAQLMASDYIAYLKMLIKEKEAKRDSLNDEINELRAELREKQGYKTLEDLGVNY